MKYAAYSVAYVSSYLDDNTFISMKGDYSTDDNEDEHTHTHTHTHIKIRRTYKYIQDKMLM